MAAIARRIGQELRADTRLPISLLSSVRRWTPSPRSTCVAILLFVFSQHARVHVVLVCSMVSARVMANASIVERPLVVSVPTLFLVLASFLVYNTSVICMEGGPVWNKTFSTDGLRLRKSGWQS